MYSEVISHASSPHSPDLVYEQETGGGNKRLSFGDMVTDTGSSGGHQSYHESEYADIPLSGKYMSCPEGGGQLNIPVLIL